MIKSLKNSLTLFLLVASLLINYSAISQTQRVVALLKEYNEALTDTAKIRIMRNLSGAYSSVDPKKKFYYARKYKALAEKNNLDTLVSTAYIDMGISYGIRSEYDSSLYYFSLALKKATLLNYQIDIGKSYSNMGYTYHRMGNKKEAVKCYEKALKIFKKLKIVKHINQCYMNLGSVYFDLEQYAFSQSYFEQVLKSFEELNDQDGIAKACFALGNTYRMQQKLALSKEVYLKSLDIRKKSGDLNGIALATWGLGQILAFEKKYNEALVNYELALNINQQLKDRYQECAVLFSIIDAYEHLENDKKANEYAEKALRIGKIISSTEIITTSLKQLIRINKRQEKHSKAFEYQEAYIKISDSLHLQNTTNEVKATDFNRIRSDNTDLEKDNEEITLKNLGYKKVIGLFALLLLVVLVLLILYLRKNYQKVKINKQLERQKEEVSTVNERLEELNNTLEKVNTELFTQIELTTAQNAELEKVNAVKNKFFSLVSHDLKSPIASLKMLFDCYRDGQLSNDEMASMFEKMEESITTTADFLDNLLEWSRNQLEGMVIHPTEFDVATLVSENIKLIQTPLHAKGIQVVSTIAQPTILFADRNMLNVVFRNLISNSVKFCTAGDTLSFSATSNAEKIILSVADTGMGISLEDQKKLFQLESTLTQGTAGEKGHHIGLILCKEMVEQNGGTLHFESTVGIGTTFFITLPLHSTETRM